MHEVPGQVLRVTFRVFLEKVFLRLIEGMKLKKCVFSLNLHKNFELWITGTFKMQKNVLSGKYWGLQGLLTAEPLSCSSLFIKVTKEV